jgi:hypothetical protein
MSNARLGETAGSNRELLAGFLAKGAVLGLIVYMLTSYDLHRLAKEWFYGEFLWI